MTGSTETEETKEKMIALKAIWTFLNSRLFLIILIVLLLLVGLGEYKKIRDLNREVEIHEQNTAALTDSLRFEREKSGNLLVSINGYISSEKELKELNRGLWEEVRGQKGKVLMLTNTILTLREDSTDLANAVDSMGVVIGELKQNGDKYTAPWEITRKYDKDNYFKVKGATVVQVTNKEPFQMRHDTTYLSLYENRISITYGQKVENDKLRIYIQSKYPGFTVESMEGVLIDPNEWPSVFKPTKRHWFTGFAVGPNITMGYDFFNGRPAFLFGVGIQYNIYQW